MKNSDPISEEELTALENCFTEEEWDVAYDKIKKSRGGKNPVDWFVRVIKPGTMDRILNRFRYDLTDQDESMKEWKINTRVKAVIQITESGKLPGDPEAKPLDSGWIHAEPGELGTVVHSDGGFLPSVRFDRTGTVTCVRDDEIQEV